MKRLYYLIIVLGIFFSHLSCDTENKKNKLSGLQVKQLDSHRIEKIAYYSDGKMEYKLQMFDNLMDGPCEEYYPNGRIKVRSFWKKGHQSFNYEKYTDDGTRISIFRTVKINKTNSLKIGQFNNNIRIWLSDTTKNVAMYICDFKDDFVSGKSITVPVEDGFGIIAFTPSKKNAKIKGVIRVVRDKVFFEESYPFEFFLTIK